MEIDVNNLAHVYNHTVPEVKALELLSLHIRDGEFVAIVGANGCGKSTLLRIMANLIQPTRGSVLLDGVSPEVMTANRKVVWMAQDPALLPWCTARQNILMAQRFASASRQSMAAADDLLRMVGLGDFSSAYPNTLSGGMQQRLSLARALAMNADLWLMDEPFAPLDELTRERLTVQLSEIWLRSRPTVLWVTHSIPEAVRLADRVLVMTPHPGRLYGEVRVPLPRPRDDTAAQFQAVVRKLKQMLTACEGLR